MANNYNIKSIKEEFKAKGIFYTPPELAELMKSYIDIEDYKEVYDPTCGHGGLLEQFPEEIKKYGQDMNEIAIEYAKNNLINFEGVVGDTINFDMFPGKQFQVILANPPFSIKYENLNDLENDVRFKDLPKDKKGKTILAPNSYADYMFIYHCIHKLSENGVLVAMDFPGILYRKNKEHFLRKNLIDLNLIDKVVYIPGNKFIDTTVPTILLVIKKNRGEKTSVEFIDTENNLSRNVEIEEIIRNDFNLSVSSYVEKPTVKEVIDIDIITNERIENYLNYTRDFLDTQLMLIEVFGQEIDFYNLVKEFKKIINTAERRYKQIINERENVGKQNQETFRGQRTLFPENTWYNFK